MSSESLLLVLSSGYKSVGLTFYQLLIKFLEKDLRVSDKHITL